MTKRDWHIAGDATREKLAACKFPYVTALASGTMRCVLFAPRKVDEQRPHTQDELYIIASGSAAFIRGQERVRVGPGDTVFVPAGLEHRFEGMSGDFESWAVFWGPEGGEP